MYVVDMAVDVFGGFEAPGAIGTRGRVEVGFEVAAEEVGGVSGFLGGVLYGEGWRMGIG